MGKLIKIILYIVVIAIAYIWISTVFKSCGTDPMQVAADAAEATTDAIGEVGEDLYDGASDLTEAVVEETENIFEGEGDAEEDFTTYQDNSEDQIIDEEDLTVEDLAEEDDFVEEKPTYASSSSGNYLIIAGNYLIKDNANQMKRKLQKASFPNAEVAVFERSQYHTVIAGRYSDYADALDGSNVLKRQGIDCYVKKKS